MLARLMQMLAKLREAADASTTAPKVENMHSMIRSNTF